VLGVEELSALKEGALVIDLASKPGGVDLDAAAALGVQVVWALSLPGKVAPVTAGKCVKDTIYNILRELGV
jgi:dipicolinate synthase subunit A